jgi:hypothetical protein
MPRRLSGKPKIRRRQGRVESYISLAAMVKKNPALLQELTEDKSAGVDRAEEALRVDPLDMQLSRLLLFGPRLAINSAGDLKTFVGA